MKKGAVFSIERIPLIWLMIGSFVVCASILLAVIYIAKPFLHTKNDVADELKKASIATVYASDRTSLFPPQ